MIDVLRPAAVYAAVHDPVRADLPDVFVAALYGLVERRILLAVHEPPRVLDHVSPCWDGFLGDYAPALYRGLDQCQPKVAEVFIETWLHGLAITSKLRPINQFPNDSQTWQRFLVTSYLRVASSNVMRLRVRCKYRLRSYRQTLPQPAHVW